MAPCCPGLTLLVDGRRRLGRLALGGDADEVHTEGSAPVFPGCRRPGVARADVDVGDPPGRAVETYASEEPEGADLLNRG
ncbi:MAG: hypothetical protein LC775_14765, partial [Acidobacteria bacterium]|nr:hypothetical protein [Acidobacteriota bacterium]